MLVSSTCSADSMLCERPCGHDAVTEPALLNTSQLTGCCHTHHCTPHQNRCARPVPASSSWFAWPVCARPCSACPTRAWQIALTRGGPCTAWTGETRVCHGSRLSAHPLLSAPFLSGSEAHAATHVTRVRTLLFTRVRTLLCKPEGAGCAPATVSQCKDTPVKLVCSKELGGICVRAPATGGGTSSNKKPSSGNSKKSSSGNSEDSSGGDSEEASSGDSEDSSIGDTKDRRLLL